ncbi:MAG: DUF309 domain-containing protein [Planctomycetes bacterium]|nr:DUF309 domain-containing protein [Planctomycetota bacterium]
MTDRNLGRSLSIIQGAELFDAGEHWHAHEVWEALWKDDRAPDRDYLKGLIHYAAACYHVKRGNLRPALRLLGSGRAHLLAHGSERWPFATQGVIDDMHALERVLSEGGVPGPVPPLMRHLTPTVG